VAILSPSDVWAVGNDTNGPTTGHTLAEHWDGASWAVASTPNPSQTRNALTDLVAFSPDDVYAVGSDSDFTLTSHSLVEHFDGASWTVSSIPSLGTENELDGIDGASPSDVWASGDVLTDKGDPRTLIEGLSGGVWSQARSPSPGRRANHLFGVAAAASDQVWALGQASSELTGSSTLIERFDGVGWKLVNSPNR